jgi:hypothetical protein
MPYAYTVPNYVMNKLLGNEELNTAEAFILELVKIAFPITKQLNIENIKKLVIPEELDAIA